MDASPNNHTITQNIDDSQDFAILKQILEADDSLKNLLTGNFNGQNFLDAGPRLKLKQIRLFLCSDYEEFKNEREVFWSDVLPEIQQHCMQYGADILIFDPYQGLNEAQCATTLSQPFYFHQCLKQIEKCRNESEGIFFLCFLGKNQGSSTAPVYVSEKTYEKLNLSAVEQELKVFNSLYKLDKNAIPPCFELQNFRSKKSISESDMEALMALFSKHHSDDQSDESGHFFFHRPCLEQMISKAILVDGKYRNSDLGTSLFYLKNYQDDSAYQMNELHEKLLSSLEKSNLIQLQRENKTQQQPQNSTLSKQSNDSISYFAQELIYKMKQLIDRTYANGYDWVSLQNQPNVEHFFCSRVEIGQIFEQIRFHFDLLYPFANTLQRSESCSIFQLHSSAVSEKCNVTWDKSECLRSISKWFSGALIAPSCPIIIQGDEGSGKSTILRRISTFAPKWLNSDVTIVARFINSCSSSKYAHELLRGVCMQICLIYELYPLMKNFGAAFTTDKVFRFFDQVCARASEKAAEQRKPLIILLDDLNQLRYATYASGRTFNFCPWVPRELPKNVIFVATVTKSFLNLNMLPIKPDSSGLCHVNLVQVTNLFGDIQFDSKFYCSKCSKFLHFKVPSLPADDLFEIVNTHLSSKKRTLSSEQQQTVRKFLSCEPTPSPLLAKFLGRECATWHSNFGPPGQFLSTKMTTYFISVIEKLEKLHAHVVAPFESLVGAWCSYLECSRYGLTETELWELIGENATDMTVSVENDQNKDILGYGYTVPCLTWLILKDMFASLIEEVAFDGKILLNWTHSMINSAVRFKFLRTNSELKTYHRNIAEMYRWSEYNNADDQDDVNINGKAPMVARLSAPQYFHPSTGRIIYDRRAAHNFWYHVFQAGTVNDFEEQSLCNYSYLDSILNVTNLLHLLSIFEEALSQILDHNLHILYGTVIRPSVDTLAYSTKYFAAELIGRLNFTRSRNTEILNNLLNQAMYWVDNVSVYPIIVPLTSWIRPPLCPLVTSLRILDYTPGMATIMQPTLNYQHLLLAGYADGRILMYHILSNMVVKSFVGHTERVLCLQLSNNGLHFATGSNDGTFRLWNLQLGSCVKNFENGTDKTSCALFTKDDKFIFTGSSDSNIKMIAFENGSIHKTLIGHTGTVSALALTNENEYLVSGSFDFVVVIWHVASGDVVYKLGGMMAPVSSLCLTSNDTFLVVACADETLRVFSLCLAKELHELRGHQGNIVSLIIGPDDCQLFAGSVDGSIYCYDLHTGQMVATQKCATTTISSLKITNGNRFLLSTGGDSIQVWNIDRPIDSWKSENSPTITVCTMSKDCKYLAVGNSTGSVLLWDLESCHYLWAVSYEFKVKITCLSFDYDNDLLFSGSIDGLICIWSILSGRLKKSIRHHTAMIRNIQFFQNKPRVLSHDSTGIVKIWRPFPADSDDDCKDVEEINVGGDLLQLANDRDLIATTSYSSKELKMWSIGSDDTATYVRAKFGHKDAITCLKMSSNGKFVLTGSKDNSIKLWEVSTGYLTQVFVGHETPVISCGMNDDNQVAVSGSVDGSVYSWDVETGSTMSTVNYHPKVEANSVAVFNDGLIVLSGYSNGWLHASTTETGQEIAGFNAHLPILEISNGREGSRIILRLSQGPRLAIVCLHNCPQLSEVFVDNNGVKRRRRSSRALSLTSAGSEGCASMNSAASTNITASIKRSVSPLVTLKGIATAGCPPSTAASSIVPLTFSSSKFPSTPLSTTTMLDDEKRQQSLTTPSIEKSVVTSFADKRSESRSSKVFATIEHNRSSQSCLFEDQLFCGSTTSQKFASGKSYSTTDRLNSSSNQNVSKVCCLM